MLWRSIKLRSVLRESEPRPTALNFRRRCLKRLTVESQARAIALADLRSSWRFEEREDTRQRDAMQTAYYGDVRLSSKTTPF